MGCGRLVVGCRRYRNIGGIGDGGRCGLLMINDNNI
jgi:hypothetical protein